MKTLLFLGSLAVGLNGFWAQGVQASSTTLAGEVCANPSKFIITTDGKCPAEPPTEKHVVVCQDTGKTLGVCLTDEMIQKHLKRKADTTAILKPVPQSRIERKLDCSMPAVYPAKPCPDGRQPRKAHCDGSDAPAKMVCGDPNSVTHVGEALQRCMILLKTSADFSPLTGVAFIKHDRSSIKSLDRVDMDEDDKPVGNKKITLHGAYSLSPEGKVFFHDCKADKKKDRFYTFPKMTGSPDIPNVGHTSKMANGFASDVWSTTKPAGAQECAGERVDDNESLQFFSDSIAQDFDTTELMAQLKDTQATHEYWRRKAENIEACSSFLTRMGSDPIAVKLNHTLVGAKALIVKTIPGAQEAVPGDSVSGAGRANSP